MYFESAEPLFDLLESDVEQLARHFNMDEEILGNLGSDVSNNVEKSLRRAEELSGHIKECAKQAKTMFWNKEEDSQQRVERILTHSLLLLETTYSEAESVTYMMEDSVRAAQTNVNKGGQSGRVSSVMTQIKNWFSKLKSLAKKIATTLWTLISGYLKVKEWKLGGKLGAAPFGLADATIEITFGP